MNKGTYLFDPNMHPHFTQMGCCSPTVAGFGAASAPPSIATAISLYQVNVAKMVGDVVQSISATSFFARSAAIEWGTQMNDVAAQVITTLRKKGANGQEFWQNYPTKALELLSDNANFMALEGREYKAAGQALLSIRAGLEQAAEVVAKNGSLAIQKAFEAGLRGATTGSPWVVVGVALVAAAWVYGQLK